jgi:hypothetical protein
MVIEQRFLGKLLMCIHYYNAINDDKARLHYAKIYFTALLNSSIIEHPVIVAQRSAISLLGDQISARIKEKNLITVDGPNILHAAKIHMANNESLFCDYLSWPTWLMYQTYRKGLISPEIFAKIQKID